jgi:hypothetical protein
MKFREFHGLDTLILSTTMEFLVYDSDSENETGLLDGISDGKTCDQNVDSVEISNTSFCASKE